MSQSRRKSILEAAAKDRGLVEQVPAVVAAGFGILPLRRLGDVLTVGCFARSNRHALRVLRDVLELEIVATPFEDRLLHEAIRRAYFPGEESVNFPTFLDPDFLEEPGSAMLLGQEKVEELGPCRLALAPERVALASLSYRSSLWNLDGPLPGGGLPDPERTRLDLGSLDVGWRLVDGEPRVFPTGALEESLSAGGPGGEALGDGVRLLLTQFRRTEYRHLHGVRLSEHDVTTVAASSLPLIVHPTEVQLVEVTVDGGLVFHAYDQRLTFPVGRPGAFSVTYYFLSYGNRMRREIEVSVHEVFSPARAQVRIGSGEAPWGPRELGRWLGVSEPAIDPAGASR